MATHDVEHRQPAGQTAPGARSIDLVWIAVLSAALLALFLLPVLLHDHAFPVGPDVPVYLWWARVAAGEGISLVGARPGTPALLPTIGAALAQGPVETLGGLQYAMGPAIGLAGAALLRGGGQASRLVWVSGALLAGVWATHLGDGYLANLVFAACFLGAAAALAQRTMRGAAAAALLVGGGGLAHPQFFVVGAVILTITALWFAWNERRLAWRGDAGRIAIAVAGGAAIVGAGLLAALAGPARLSGDTSKDAFLRRTGDTQTLRRTFLERLRLGWIRYAPWVTLPLAIAGGLHVRGFVRRFLLAWAGFTVVAFSLVLVTRSLPPDRVLTFAFCVPLLMAVGIAWVGGWLSTRYARPLLTWSVLVVLGLVAVFPALRAWISSPDFVSASEMRNAIVAGRIAELTPPGTPLVFVANDLDTNGLFHMAHVFNVARAAVPSDRANDVYVFMGSAEDLLNGRPSVRGVPNYDAASARSLAELPDEPRAVFVVHGLDDDATELDDPRLTRWDPAVAATVPGSPGQGEVPAALPAGDDEPTPSTPDAMAAATVRTLILLVLVGLGWGWWTTGDAVDGAAMAPAFGLATLTIAALAFERVGAPFATPGGATLAAASAGACGYALLIVRTRRERSERRRSSNVFEGSAGPQA